ncbi:MAG: hypothetical protein F9K23_03680 [Bacteroidetes bacterium]|nr:MAG: hypothetical protein F9K23_03680 [Bacteroidota bacterium]
MELDNETIWYVFTHCNELLTLDEKDAHTKFYTERDISERASRAGNEQFWVNFYLRAGRLKPEYP